MTETLTDSGRSPQPPPLGWSAVVALMDQASSDRRTLDASGSWQLHPQAPLMKPSTPGSALPNMTVGEVRALILSPRHMYAYGTVHHRPTAQAMADGRLLPGIGLDLEAPVHTSGHGADTAFRFTGGQVAYVMAGEQPVWPELSFTVHDSWELARDAAYRHLIEHPAHQLVNGQTPGDDVAGILAQMAATGA